MSTIAAQMIDQHDAADRASSIVELTQNLKKKQILSTEVVTAFFEDIQRKKHLNIYVKEMQDQARERAAQSDKRIAEGNPRPLEGIPIAVKDNFCTKGVETTAASKILAGFVPTYESTVTQKLLDAGAVILGKTNMDEFAMGSSTETSCFGPTFNPVGAELGFSNLVPGGSSGGSAAAVAGGLALGALGTDTGGSIRQPASFCGVVGFKPTYGVCSRWGVIAYASSLDQAGVFGKCVKDVALMMDVIAGEDPRDTTSISNAMFDFKSSPSMPTTKLRVGFPKEIMALKTTSEADAVWKQAQKTAQAIGAEIVEISLPNFSQALPAYYILALSEASSNLARYDGVKYGYRAASPKDIDDMYERTRAEGFGPEVQKRIMLGTYSLSAGFYDAYYVRAQKVRRLISNEFAAAYREVDVIFMPTAPTSAFELGSHSKDPISMYLEDVFTVPVNLAGLPAISIPIANAENGMPLGLQVIGPQFSDKTVLGVASLIEAERAG